MVTVLTRTIGPSGRDYASFTLAEADVTNIGTSADLVANDEAIVFEADAGTYTENVIFNSSLTVDATRQVTYKPAAGSEHGGAFEAGVVISLTQQKIQDDYMALSGLQFTANTNFYATTQASADGLTIDSCLFKSLDSQPAICLRGGGGSVKSIVKNCVGWSARGGGLDCVSLPYPIHVGGETVTTVVDIINCTGFGDTGNYGDYRVFNLDSTITIGYYNCLSLSSRAHSSVAGATTIISGSNNFGPSAGPFPAAIQGSPYPITPTTSFSTPLGSGDYAVYMGATGALADVTGNDVWQQGVGPASNSDVPTTDINGVTRSGTSCNPGAFEADGFVAPTVITKTIGSGKDYSTFTLAEAAVTSIGSGTDLTFYNEAIVFEADAGSYSESVTFSSSLTTDATRQVTYKAAAGSEHGGDRTQGVIVTSSGFTLNIEDAHTHVRGLVVLSSGFYTFLLREDGVVAADCIAEGTSTTSTSYAFFASSAGTASAPLRLESCVGYSSTASALYGFAGADTHIVATNVTGIVTGGSQNCFRFIEAGFTANITLTNCLAIQLGSGGACLSGTATFTGSNNFGGSTNPFPAAIQGSPYPITASTAYDPGAGDFALYVGKNGALLDSPNNDVIDQGVGPSANSDVPTTDILGNARSGATANPGAFEQPQATATITKTIGPSGRDYTTFTLAEADVTNIGGSADLVNENERIVFEADAGTYNESVSFSSTLTTDATRQVTYKPASGAEHGGVEGAGVRIQYGGASSGTVFPFDSFLKLQGLEFHSTSSVGISHRTVYATSNALGVEVRDCLIRGDGSNAIVVQFWAMDARDHETHPPTIANCVVRSVKHCISLWNYGTTDKGYRVTNCTLISTAPNGYAFDIFTNTTNTTYQITNNLILAAQYDWQDQGGGGSSVILGSNNFGPRTSASYAFPAAIQGSPYPITATTDTDPGAGDWAIYDAETGALVNVPANDVLKQGVGPASDSDVPTTDILGYPRFGDTADPGAFEVSARYLVARLGAAPQVMPTDENFSHPTFMQATDGSGNYDAFPFLDQYPSWSPSEGLDSGASEYSACPLRAGGPMETAGWPQLFHPATGAPGGSFPTYVTDQTVAAETQLRGFLCRSEDACDHNHQSVEVVFGVQQIAGVTSGALTQGRNGSSPTGQGVRRVPTADDSTADESTTLAHTSNRTTSFLGSPGGHLPSAAVPSYNGWLGSAVAIRMGGGRPDNEQESTSELWRHRGLDHYLFAAYPLKNGSAIDLHMELWRFNYSGSSPNGTPTLLASHVEADGVSLLQFRQNLLLRVEAETNGSSEVELKAYIGPVRHGAHFDIHQVFKASEWSNETITAGPSGDGAVATNTGIVTDSGTDKITAHSGKTFGWLCGRDRILDVSPWTGEQVTTTVIEGVIRASVRDLDTGEYTYTDRWQRAGQPGNPILGMDRFVFGNFNAGPSAQGLWWWDANCRVLDDGQNGAAKRLPMLQWAANYGGATFPRNFVTANIDPTPSPLGTTAPGGTARFFGYKVPTAKRYNHHRILEVQLPSSNGVAAMAFATGIVARGQMSQGLVQGIAFFVHFDTNIGGTGQYARLVLAYIDASANEDPIGGILDSGPYGTGYTDNSLAIADISAAALPGSTHTLQLKVETDASSPTSDGQALYTAYWDGAPVTFTTLNDNATQDNTSKVVTHASPPGYSTEGRTHAAFVWTSEPQSATPTYYDAKLLNWVEGVSADDPSGPITNADIASVAVTDEGTATVNLSTVLEEVDWTIRVAYERPRYDIGFASGHRYTSPKYTSTRRVITATAVHVTKATMDNIVSFYNARNGVEEAFFFNFPVPDSATSETLDTIKVSFQSIDGLRYERVQEDVYSVQLNMVEVL